MSAVSCPGLMVDTLSLRSYAERSCHVIAEMQPAPGWQNQAQYTVRQDWEGPVAPERLMLVCIAQGDKAFLKSALFAATYMGIKVNIVYNRAKLAVAAFWNVGLAANAHGQPASPEDLMEAGAVCSICQVSHCSSLITSHLPQ